MAKWLKETGPESDIVISSRVRIARNIQNFPFPHLLDESIGEQVMTMLHDSVANGGEGLREEFSFHKMKELNRIDRLDYVEKHLISPDLARKTSVGAMLVNREGTISILINEEDHVRIQSLLPGLQLEGAWDLADKVDDLIEEKVQYAFHEQMGYLTACPTNLGTGIRASVMMHLPALRMTGYINGVFQASSQIGIAVRGIYGEGTEFLGNLFQISNQLTLGLSEEELIRNLKDVSLQIVQKERMMRENLMQEKRTELEDRIFRAYGILKNARVIASNEAMSLLSDVKLGIALELIDKISLGQMNQLMGMIQIGYLQKNYGEELTESERDVKRAEIIREILNS